MKITKLSIGNRAIEGANNVYVVQCGDAVALVDTTVAMAEFENELVKRLRESIGGLDRIKTVFVTHFHPDHSGLAGMIQEASGATVIVHDQDEATIYQRLQLENPEEPEKQFGLPPEKRDQLPESSAELIVEPNEITAVTDGDTVTVGDCTFRAVHAPGHSAGSCIFEFMQDGYREAFVGDVLLPDYTPNIGTDPRLEHHLETYVSSLKALIDRGYQRVYPGHGAVIEEPAARARETIGHHRDRTAEIIHTLEGRGPMSVWSVTSQIFDELEGVHISLAVNEVFAHLEHLRHHGVVREGNDSAEYELVEPDPELDELIAPHVTT